MPSRLFPFPARRPLRAVRVRYLVLLAGLPALDARAAEPMAVSLASDAPLPVSLVLAADPASTRVVEAGGAVNTPLAPDTAPPPPVLRPQKIPADTSAIAGEERAPLSPQGTFRVPSGAGPEAVPLPYTVFINGRRVGDATLLQLRDGRLLARRDDLGRWRLSPPPGTPFILEDEVYYSLDLLAGYHASLDAANQRAELTFAPAAFQLTQLATTQTQQTLAKKPQALGAYLNYDFLGSRIQGYGAPSSDTLSGLGEAVVFDTWGALTSTFSATNLVNDQNYASSSRKLVRLETAYERDDPATLRTLILGDTISGSGLLSRPVRMGGIRYTRNFATQPGFVTFPQPTLTGEAALPSVVEVYANGVRQQQQAITPGPFQIDAVPTINGQGDVQVVVRDILGREQVISQSYFVGSRQLGRGLSDFSYEAGFLRLNLGLQDNNYGNLAALGTQRYGFTDTFTGEAHLEFEDNGLQGASVGGIYGVSPLGVFTAGAAVSHSGSGTGTQGLIGFNRTVRRAVSFGFQYIAATPQFQTVGLTPGVSLPARQLSSNVNFSLGRFGGLGVGYFNIRTRGNYLNSTIAGGTLFDPSARALGVTTEFFTLSYSNSIKGVGTNLILTERVRPERDFSVSLRGILPLGGRRYASAVVTQQRDAQGNNQGLVGVGFQSSRSSDLGVGYGVELRKAHGDFANDDVQVDASANWNAQYATTDAAVSHISGGTAVRLGVAGSVGTFAGHNFASRYISSGFAVVETGVEGIDLTVQSQPSARTDADGVAVLPRVQSYNLNRVQIDPTNLPINVAVPYDTVDATPYYRSGVLISLPAEIRHTAVASLMRANGKPVPAGAVLTVGENANPVGRKGLVYIANLGVGTTTAVASWGANRCTVTLNLPENADFQYDLGTLTCQETSR